MSGPLLALALVGLVGTCTAIALSMIPGLLATMAIVDAIRHASRAEERKRQALRLRVRPVLTGRLGDHRGAVLVLVLGVALFGLAYDGFATGPASVPALAPWFVAAEVAIGCAETAEHAAVAALAPVELRGSAFGLLEEVGAGRHKGSRPRSMAELLERWLEWRSAYPGGVGVGRSSAAPEMRIRPGSMAATRSQAT